MPAFDPLQQNVTFFGPDGKTEIHVPMAMVDLLNFTGVTECISYGTELGMCLIMLCVLLILTPTAKLRRPSNVLQIAGLAANIIRMVLLVLYFPSPFNEFYRDWAGDFSTVPVPNSDYQISVVATTFSVVVVAIQELALMNQAWTMVSLWPSSAKYALSCLSAAVTANTIISRMAFVVVQNEFIVDLVVPAGMDLCSNWCIVSNALSIFYFCTIFNFKLVHHLISNKGVLPSYQAMNPMEVLVMANGILMIVPVVFAGLQWGNFTDFEAGSWSLTSVAIILPMGTLAAQRMARTNNLGGGGCCSHCSTLRGFNIPGAGNAGLGGGGGSSTSSGSAGYHKPGSFATSTSGGSAKDGGYGGGPQVSVMSRCEAAAAFSSRERLDPVDLELYHIDGQLGEGQVRVQRGLEQRVERL